MRNHAAIVLNEGEIPEDVAIVACFVVTLDSDGNYRAVAHDVPYTEYAPGSPRPDEEAIDYLRVQIEHTWEIAALITLVEGPADEEENTHGE